MAVLTIKKDKFEKEIGTINEELEEKIALFGTPIDSINEEEINIEIFPNRPDLLSYENWKCAFLLFNDSKKHPDYQLKDSKQKVIVDKSVNKVRPFCMAAIVKNVSFTDERIKEIMQFQEKIHSTIGRNRKKVAMGYYILDKIKFPIHYTAKSPKEIIFQPLEFHEKMNSIEILERHPCGVEYGHLIKNFNQFPIYIDSNNQILSLPPIINSEELGRIDQSTKNVLIEASGTDKEILKKVILMACIDLANCGGEIFSVDIIYENKKDKINLKPIKTKFNYKNANSLLGIEIKKQEAKKLLKRMGHTLKEGVVESPPWRTDILHEVDLIEEIAIAYGYNKFEAKIPQISTIGESDKRELIKNKIADLLIGLEFQEISNYHLTTKEFQIDKIGRQYRDIIEVEKSKTEFNILRRDLTHYALKILAENVDVEYPHKIFEIGKIFFKSKEEIVEEEHLSIALSPNDFTKLKQIIDYIIRMLNIKVEITLPENENSYFIDGRYAEIKFNNKSIGHFGEINPEILERFKIKMPVSSLEINIEDIIKSLAR
ncbi:MAG: phenylalanine--tRNA ligase subunit beta [Candidatus Pacearchaeota archaeon]